MSIGNLARERQASLFEYFISESLFVKNECPILYTEFTSFSPPYKPSCCEHRMSLKAIRGLPIINNGTTPKYLLCPFCKQKFTSAAIDSGYLFWTQIQTTIKLWKTKSLISETPGILAQAIDTVLLSWKENSILRNTSKPFRVEEYYAVRKTN
jgi:hypothetical protein